MRVKPEPVPVRACFRARGAVRGSCAGWMAQQLPVSSPTASIPPPLCQELCVWGGHAGGLPSTFSTFLSSFPSLLSRMNPSPPSWRTQKPAGGGTLTSSLNSQDLSPPLALPQAPSKRRGTLFLLRLSPSQHTPGLSSGGALASSIHPAPINGNSTSTHLPLPPLTKL